MGLGAWAGLRAGAPGGAGPWMTVRAWHRRGAGSPTLLGLRHPNGSHLPWLPEEGTRTPGQACGNWWNRGPGGPGALRIYESHPLGSFSSGFIRLLGINPSPTPYPFTTRADSLRCLLREQSWGHPAPGAWQVPTPVRKPPHPLRPAFRQLPHPHPPCTWTFWKWPAPRQAHLVLAIQASPVRHTGHGGPGGSFEVELREEAHVFRAICCGDTQWSFIGKSFLIRTAAGTADTSFHEPKAMFTKTFQRFGEGAPDPPLGRRCWVVGGWGPTVRTWAQRVLGLSPHYVTHLWVMNQMPLSSKTDVPESGPCPCHRCPNWASKPAWLPRHLL